ncbi:DUF1311 domain-containing protein [Lysobacter sp. BMK333-48F3]|uniref:lysozyme inhibitor LprI family protein n=1 Tax=Lysobacter sp. BMK333-48F3 TaxID=2867962 RepID=UPI001C8C01D3|nr:lysozyme inhibitor LprI family protein [Lysobacter sp. BMK333-48F3]MBX9400278.1 DUF1311 domain-containing protein [Lysobacter sp. BMK333-48F3]
MAANDPGVAASVEAVEAAERIRQAQMRANQGESRIGQATQKSQHYQTGDDCMAIADLDAREECFALSEDYRRCADSDLHCAPYKKMYALRGQLAKLEADAYALADKAYGNLKMWDQTYLVDMKESFTKSNSAWRVYRDSHCTAEQFYAGTTRKDIGDLAEACRAQLTQARIEEMKTLLQGLKPLEDGDHER